MNEPPLLEKYHAYRRAFDVVCSDGSRYWSLELVVAEIARQGVQVSLEEAKAFYAIELSVAQQLALCESHREEQAP